MGNPSPARIAAEQRAIRAELARRERLPRALEAYLATLTPWQSGVVLSDAKRITTWAGRRTGKTYGPVVGRALRAAVRFPGATIPVFQRTLTARSTQVFWKALHDVVEAHQLEAKFDNRLYACTLSNRSTIQCLGADTIEACDKARGDAYPEAIIDEAGTFRPHVLRYLNHEVIDPALIDYRGALTMAGTPVPRFEDNPFYEACVTLPTGVWERHHSTFLENDALPLGMESATPEERRAARYAEFELMLQRRGVDRDDPSVQREWLGQWVRDTNGLVYRLGPGNHLGVRAPELDRGWRFGLGIDLGFEDPCAFVVFAWRIGDPRVWVLESYQRPELTPTRVVVEVERLRARYHFRWIVADTGGYGKGPVEELRAHNIIVTAADKRGKEGHVWAANGDLQAGLVQIVEATNRELIADLYGLRRGEDGDLEHPADANHLPDAFLYGLMALRGRNRGLGDRDPPAPYSLEWWRAQEDAWEAADEEQHRRGRAGANDALTAAVNQLPRA